MAIHYCRLRLGCSKLNSDLCNNLFVKDSANCMCGNICENASHYLLYCPLFAAQREILMEKIDFLTDVTTEILLFGHENLSYNDNALIFTSVHEFLQTTCRFE